MADRRGLGLIGYLMGGMTAAVMLIGAIVVTMSIADNADASTPSVSLDAQSR